METSNILIAFGLTLFAGLSTGIGSALAFFTHKTNTKFLSISLGFSAGVMIYVSFVEIFAEARISLISALGEYRGNIATVAAFFFGMFLIAIIDKLVPSFENPHEMRNIEDLDKPCPRNFNLLRMGILSALAITIHNFPEGIATFASALKDPKLGISIAIAIAIHNIPEGIAISVPIYFATGKKKIAFIYSFLSGLSEPIGALVGYFFISSITHELVFGVLFASVSGIMVFISLDELLPAAQKYGEHHHSIYGLVAGMLLMAISLILFI